MPQGLLGVVADYEPITAQVGTFNDQAVNVLEADRVAATPPSNIIGTGVTVGVLSDSFNNLGGASTDEADGNLPATVNVIQDLTSGGTDEGRAMLQLVHHTAPALPRRSPRATSAATPASLTTSSSWPTPAPR